MFGGNQLATQLQIGRIRCYSCWRIRFDILGSIENAKGDVHEKRLYLFVHKQMSVNGGLKSSVWDTWVVCG